MSSEQNENNSLARRKSVHIDICCDEQLNVEGSRTWFDRVEFLHHSLPEIHYNEISTATQFLNYTLKAPFMISCMTGGSEKGYALNKILAQSAQAEGIAVGTGSLRIVLRKPEVIDHFRFKEMAPNVPVLGNIGAVQLPEFYADNGGVMKKFLGILRELEVDALVVHLNPGQEMFQKDGDRDFSHILASIKRLCNETDLPIIVKETGAGIAPHETSALFKAGVQFVDIAGAGGTNWIAVEALREQNKYASFTHWGIPTAIALSASQEYCRGIIPAGGGFIASGGLRIASDFAKAIAMGAGIAATALPFIRIAKEQGIEGCMGYIQQLKTDMKRIMLLSSSTNITDLRKTELLYKKEFEEYRNSVLRIAPQAEYRLQARTAQSRNIMGNTTDNTIDSAQELAPDNEGDSTALFSAPFGDRSFWKQSIQERREILGALASSKHKEFDASSAQPDMLNIADSMIESALGTMPLPLGIVRGVLIDGAQYNIPLAVEEPSVIAAATYAAGLIARSGGFTTHADKSIMRACVYISLNTANPSQKDISQESVQKHRQAIMDNEPEIREIIAPTLSSMAERGGGYCGLESQWLPQSQALRVDILIDVCDAMGANLLNSVAEEITPFLERITGGEKLMAILSNKAEKRCASASFAIPLSSLRRGEYFGRSLGERVVRLARIAQEDPMRAVTHNKGIMNGISSLTLATANDTRAIEAGAHAWASRSGRYTSLSSYSIRADVLQGELAFPVVLGTVGGAVSYHPAAQLALAILGNPNAQRLARIAAALGLAQNFAALLALASEGIQKGHLALHERRKKG